MPAQLLVELEALLRRSDRRTRDDRELIIASARSRAEGLAQVLSGSPDAARVVGVAFCGDVLSGLWLERPLRGDALTRLVDQIANVLGIDANVASVAIYLRALREQHLLMLPPNLAHREPTRAAGRLRRVGRGFVVDRRRSRAAGPGRPLRGPRAEPAGSARCTCCSHRRTRRQQTGSAPGRSGVALAATGALRSSSGLGAAARRRAVARSRSRRLDGAACSSSTPCSNGVPSVSAHSSRRASDSSCDSASTSTTAPSRVSPRWPRRCGSFARSFRSCSTGPSTGISFSAASGTSRQRVVAQSTASCVS